MPARASEPWPGSTSDSTAAMARWFTAAMVTIDTATATTLRPDRPASSRRAAKHRDPAPAAAIHWATLKQSLAGRVLSDSSEIPMDRAATATATGPASENTTGAMTASNRSKAA